MIGLAKRLINRLRSPSEVIEGYQHPDLVEVVFRKTVAYRPSGAWQEAAQTVLDFGGGCGLHYKEANSRSVRWAVVETPAMVRRARELETDKLAFFSEIADAAEWLGKIDLVHSNGAIQYTENPLANVEQLCALRARGIIWKRVWFGASDVQTSRLLDNGPGSTSGADKLLKYPRNGLNEADFIAAHRGYRLIERQGTDFRFRI